MSLYRATILILAFTFSVATMFAADPPPWAYGFEGPPQAGSKPTPIGPVIMDRTPRSIPGAGVNGLSVEYFISSTR